MSIGFFNVQELLIFAIFNGVQNAVLADRYKSVSGISPMIGSNFVFLFLNTYCDAEDWCLEYYDETFILLDETGGYIVSREELIGLIGDHQNIFRWEYGAGMMVAC